MMADLDDKDPGDPGKPGKGVGGYRDFRPDFDETDDEPQHFLEDDDPTLPRHLRDMSLRLHVHFSF